MNSYTSEFRAVIPRFRFSYALGVTASHADILDYRAMLARFRVGGLPAANVRYELMNDEPLRSLDERYRAAVKCRLTSWVNWCPCHGWCL